MHVYEYVADISLSLQWMVDWLVVVLYNSDGMEAARLDVMALHQSTQRKIPMYDIIQQSNKLESVLIERHQSTHLVTARY